MAVDAIADFDFTDGPRRMARPVRGAKKYVNSRFRHHENAACKTLCKTAHFNRKRIGLKALYGKVERVKGIEPSS